MKTIKDGAPCDIPPVQEVCSGDVFDNCIRAFGVINACEWFGYPSDSEFTRQTALVLRDRSNAASQEES